MDGLEGLGLLLSSNCVAEDKEVILQRTSNLRFTLPPFLLLSLPVVDLLSNGQFWDQPFCPLYRGCPLFGG